jgi:hypothetical protein
MKKDMIEFIVKDCGDRDVGIDPREYEVSMECPIPEDMKEDRKEWIDGIKSFLKEAYDNCTMIVVYTKEEWVKMTEEDV